MPEWGFLIFWIFTLFFIWKFLAQVGKEHNSGVKFFLSFSAYLIPFWLKIMPEIGFLIPFYIFFGIFLPGSRMNGIRVYNFFLSFSAYLIPFLLKIMSERGFLVFFFNFFAFFLEFSCPGRVWTEFVTKFFSLFLSLYYPVLAKNNAGKGFF